MSTAVMRRHNPETGKDIPMTDNDDNKPNVCPLCAPRSWGNGMKEENNSVRIEHYVCDCGHKWQREMYDGLVAIDCPNCGREHPTMLSRFMLPIAQPPGA